MTQIRLVARLEECEALWRSAIPQEVITDLWETRACFQRHFQRPPLFVVAEDDRGLAGLLPLSWIEESGCYGYFPGETWHGQTWLEQNRILARDAGVLDAMLQAIPGKYHLRYLNPPAVIPEAQRVVDEIGYIFPAPKYNYDFENYLKEFSHRSAKRLRRDLEEIESQGAEYTYDVFEDYEHVVRLNISRFGKESYFADDRFTRGFRDLRDLLAQNGWLRFTTVRLAGQIAAVDMGCVYKNFYTLLAGGTHNDFPGVAKLINILHMRRACRERFEQADFLCGDFCWKTLFHLTPRPLCLIANIRLADPHHPDACPSGSATSAQ
ncbi:MAG TPA: GNAT family N-acetyltransferase [Candidatus Brocadiia bacterium]|nr:GNAT family N-acetyltransferase [Candidatus Brocadiia bacterium]